MALAPKMVCTDVQYEYLYNVMSPVTFHGVKKPHLGEARHHKEQQAPNKQHAHAHTHQQTHRHTDTHTHMHMHMHKRIRTCTRMLTHICNQIDMLAEMHTHTDRDTQTLHAILNPSALCEGTEAKGNNTHAHTHTHNH